MFLTLRCLKHCTTPGELKEEQKALPLINQMSANLDLEQIGIEDSMALQTCHPYRSYRVIKLVGSSLVCKVGGTKKEARGKSSFAEEPTHATHMK
jgi:hypothetical protein